MLTKRKEDVGTPNNILVIDVASEAYRLYRLVLNLDVSNAATCMFEMGGQPCIAVHVPIAGLPDDHSEQLMQGDQQQLEKKLPGPGKWG